MLSQKSWHIESVLRLLVRLGVCVCLGILLAQALRALCGGNNFESSLLGLGLGVMVTHVLPLGIMALFLREEKTTWAQAFGLTLQPGWAVGLGAALAVVLLPVIWAIQGLMLRVFKDMGFDFPAQDAIRLLGEAHGFWQFTALGLFAVVIAPVAEEVIFRGFLYQALKNWTSRRFALVIVAVFFGLVHGSVPIILPLTVLALVLTMLYEWTGNLLAPIAVHSLFNAANFAAFFFMEKLDKFPLRP